MNKKELDKKEYMDNLDAILRLQDKLSAEESLKIEKLVAHKFSDALSDNNTALTRGERKAFKKAKDLDARHFDQFDPEQKEEFFEFLLETRGIKDPDELSEGELAMWAQMIIGRAINPLAYEGK